MGNQVRYIDLGLVPKEVYTGVWEYQNVVDVLRGKGEPMTDGREGLKSLELLIGAYQSTRLEKPVYLPLDY